VGSAALISGDGLLLTAAHVLQSEVEVVFPKDATATRYRADIVFVNEARDVALLRAVGHRSSTWFEVALSDDIKAGEPVVAIGNPSIGAAGTAVNAISRGIVAKPYEASGGLDGIVADIAVASGSSGGPLVSARTGKLVGVVTAVVSPKISQDFATSGYWAIAAPSTELNGWLGLDYGE
jgi:serine protease Do